MLVLIELRSSQKAHAHPASSDLDVAKGTNAKQLLEKHWDTWITQREWNWMASVGVNSVRLPIGYYHVCGADRSILNDTDFFPYYSVYEGAWRRITQAILTASRMNMTVLIGTYLFAVLNLVRAPIISHFLIHLHAAPGKQNADPHSGTSNSPHNFFNDPHNLRRGLYALSSLTRNLYSFLSAQSPPITGTVIGIELVNEPAPPTDKILMDWYVKAIEEVRNAWPGVTIYLGEWWKPTLYADFVLREGVAGEDDERGLIVLDHHLYRCFTAQDIRTSVQDHTRALIDTNGGTQKTFSSVAEKMGREAGGGFVVAEWSCGLNSNSLRNIAGERRAFVDAQLSLYEQYCGGWWFWTLKKEEGVYPRDVGWSLKDAVEAGVFPNSIGMKRKRKPDTSVRERTRRQQVLEKQRSEALRAHETHWSRFPGQYQHHRFSTGFAHGWTDSYSFFDSLNSDSASVRFGMQCIPDTLLLNAF
ncbi:hypothetical protein EST38_g12715 [Candolleomyces aberdarensis]|uniref:Glycoside hydrolase family 5 domain-containing protein n=1 Tax=Candolleomyces aberdarensis TaxID=2316362 RepID=A0A4Q2D2I3_9AGAR|nr:hypothetical protein EST38_g12715 [Candolleomyces aberdarensis]